MVRTLFLSLVEDYIINILIGSLRKVLGFIEISNCSTVRSVFGLKSAFFCFSKKQTKKNLKYKKVAN